MSRLQRAVLIVTAALIMGAGAWPPFEDVAGNGQRPSEGFAWIFSPRNDVAQVNARQLVVEWVGLLLAGGLLWLAAYPRDREPAMGDPLKNLGKQVVDALNEVTRND